MTVPCLSTLKRAFVVGSLMVSVGCSSEPPAFNGTLLKALPPHDAAVSALAFSPDGRSLATGAADNILRVWDVESGQVALTFFTTGTTLSALTYSGDGRYLVSGLTDQVGDGTIRIWEPADASTMRIFPGMPGFPSLPSIAMSEDNQYLVAALSGLDPAVAGRVRIWDVASGIEVRSLTGPTQAVTVVALSRDGRFLAAGSRDRSIFVWNMADGTVAHTLTGHDGAITSLAFSPDGTLLASGSEDKTVQVWKMENGRSSRSLTGHAGGITSVAYSPDGTLMASGSADGTVRVWAAKNGKEIASLDGHEGPVTAVAFARDGSLLASGSADRTVRLWNVR